MGPGLPEQAASTAQAMAFTSAGSGRTVSFRQLGGLERVDFLAISVPKDYILSGTSMPKSAMPFFKIFATFCANTKRVVFSSGVSAFKML